MTFYSFTPQIIETEWPPFQSTGQIEKFHVVRGIAAGLRLNPRLAEKAEAGQARWVRRIAGRVALANWLTLAHLVDLPQLGFTSIN